MKSNIAADMETVINFSNGDVEVLGLYSKTKNLLFLVLYRQPDDVISGHSSTHLEFKQAVNKLREASSLTASSTPDILFCGYFNLPHVAWLEGHAGLRACRDEQIMIDDLLGLANKYFLTQLIQKPTHRHGNTLDLIFSNNPMIIHSCNIVATILSDHGIIEYQTTYSPTALDEKKIMKRMLILGGGGGGYSLTS